MPVLGRKHSNRSKDAENIRPGLPPQPRRSLPGPPEDPHRYRPLASHPIPPRNELTFHCQLSHGSPTKDIKDFSNVKELYAKVGEAFGIDPNTIIFCTLNTHKVDMTRLLGGQIGLDDFIFAHVQGNPKSVTISKQEASIGLTITDNGAGIAFVKRIKEGSVAAETKSISVGDMIVSIDERKLIGTKHFEVAKILKEIPQFSTFTIELIEPLKPFAIAPRSNSSGKLNRPLSQLLDETQPSLEGDEMKEVIGDGKGTLRLKKNGVATVEDNTSPWLSKIIERIDDQLESFMGIRDSQLSHLIVDLSNEVSSISEYKDILKEGELKDFQFTDDFIHNVWRAMGK